MLPLLSGWRQEVRDLHEGSIQRRLSRVRALRGSLTATHGAVQPGLFDRRTSFDGATVQRGDDRLASEYAEAIQALERARELDVKCEPAALLLLWP